jgi:hypothetical protein
VNLRLCHNDGAATFDLPFGMVVFLHSSFAVCPAGFSDFTDAHGRFLVFADAAKAMIGGTLVNAAPAVTVSAGNVGDHAHYMPPISVATMGRMQAYSPYIVAAAYSPARFAPTRTLGATTSSSDHLRLPYIQLRTCEVTNSQAGSAALISPNASLIFFYNGQTCPGAWVEASSRSDGGGNKYSAIAGRMIFTLYKSGPTFSGQTNTDGATLACASRACGLLGHDGHYHSVKTSNITLPSTYGGAISAKQGYRNYTGEVHVSILRQGHPSTNGCQQHLRMDVMTAAFP